MSALTPRPGILELTPYVAGKSAIEAVKLSANESALGPSPRAIDAYRSASASLHLYPDGGSIQLRAALGARHGLDPDRIVCGAGSDEILYNLARGYAGPGDEVLYSEHGFNVYPIVARCVGAEPVTAPEHDLTFDVDATLARVTPRTRLVFIANPNNPTGTYIPANELRRLREGLPGDVLLVIDCAYAEYVMRNDYATGVDLVDGGENTVMTRTFSKIYGLAALRIGWAYCPPSIAGVLNRLRGPFNLSSAAQAAGKAAVEDDAHIAASRDHNAVWLPWLTGRLTAAGLHVYPAAANFILVRFPKDQAHNAATAMDFFAGRGLIPRETIGYGLPQCLRITIGREADMRAFADAADSFMSAK